jgi:hypothetical protein
MAVFSHPVSPGEYFARSRHSSACVRKHARLGSHEHPGRTSEVRQRLAMFRLNSQRSKLVMQGAYRSPSLDRAKDLALNQELHRRSVV